MASMKNKSKSKKRKSKMATTKRSRKVVRAKAAVKPSRPKKAAKKKQAKNKTAMAPLVRQHGTLRNDAQELKSAQSRRNAISGRQSGDLQGLSRAEEADSESVDELVEEGNLFEAGAVAGVEEADSADEREVHTHEVPEDDVPEEYRDED